MIVKYVLIFLVIIIVIITIFNDSFRLIIELLAKRHTFTSEIGRLCNQIIRNLCVSIIAKKYDLFVEYSSYNQMTELGLDMFVGKNTYSNRIELTDDNFFTILNADSLTSNLNPNYNYFQTKEITNYLFDYLRQDNIKNQIIEKNPFKSRYNNNDDCVIHIRLGDVEKFNPGLGYYLKALGLFKFNKLYISSDESNHKIIKDITKIHDAEILNYNEIQTIQFGSTCKNVVLSHGSFSAVIGYLSFFSNVYYKEYEENRWYGDMFSIPSWNMIKLTDV